MPCLWQPLGLLVEAPANFTIILTFEIVTGKAYQPLFNSIIGLCSEFQIVVCFLEIRAFPCTL